MAASEDSGRVMSPSRYQTALSSIPAPGTGCHVALLAVANLGVLAGIPLDQLHHDIRGNIPAGRRKVTDREIREAIEKAAADHCPGVRRKYSVKSKPAIKDGTAVRSKIIAQSKIHSEIDLIESSRGRLPDSPEEDGIIFIESLFKPEDLLFIGERQELGIVGKNIKTAEKWVQDLKSGFKAGPFIICNPLTGKPAPTKSGGQSYRGDNNVSAFRYGIAEFDNLSIEDQIRFWTAVRLPITALVHTGGKSIHAWIRIEGIVDLESWNREIKVRLYERLLIPLGLDRACSNPARLSRLPGFVRKESGAMQRLLYFGAEIDARIRTAVERGKSGQDSPGAFAAGGLN